METLWRNCCVDPHKIHTDPRTKKVPHFASTPRVTQDDPRVTHGDLWLTKDDLRVTQDDPRVTQEDPRMTPG